jgi:peptidoglycan/LPS O-acetylase OafA/YrhL
VNGALWTLPWELRAYLLLGILGAIGAFRRRWVIVAVFLACWVEFAREIFSHPGLQTSVAVTSGIRLFTFFFAGTLIYVYRKAIPVKWQLFVLSIGVIVAATVIGTITPVYSGGVFYTVAPAPLAYATLYLGMRLNITKVNSVNDRSYGIYIYGTLMLNVFVCLGLHHVFNDGSGLWNWLGYVLLTYLATYIVATLSWFLIEKPAMSFKDRPPWRRSGKSAPDTRSTRGDARHVTGDATQ